MQRPAILLADEPTGNLDSRTSEEILDLFESLHREGQTIVIVTHEPDIARRCRRVVRLRDGQVESDGRLQLAESPAAASAVRRDGGGAMIFFSNAFNALEQLVTHKMRSLLTILAIVIAVTATITVVSVVQGFTRYVSNFLEGLGTNAVFVAPQRPAGDAGKSLGRVELDENDFRAIESQCSALRRVSPLIPRQGVKMRLGREEITVNIEGVSPAYHTVRNFPVDIRPAVCGGRCGAVPAGMRGGT